MSQRNTCTKFMPEIPPGNESHAGKTFTDQLAMLQPRGVDWGWGLGSSYMEVGTDVHPEWPKYMNPPPLTFSDRRVEGPNFFYQGKKSSLVNRLHKPVLLNNGIYFIYKLGPFFELWLVGWLC